MIGFLLKLGLTGQRQDGGQDGDLVEKRAQSSLTKLGSKREYAMSTLICILLQTKVRMERKEEKKEIKVYKIAFLTQTLLSATTYLFVGEKSDLSQ